jgi:N4-gp56 family major capsid protein
MAVTGTAALSAEVKAVYDGDFYIAGQSMLYWDQFCDLKIEMNGQRGQSYEFPVIYNLQPNTGPLDELMDVPSQQMRASAVSVTLQEYGGAVEVTKFAVATVYSDVYKQAAYANGYNLAESFDNIVRAVAGQGSRQFFINARTARSQIAGQSTSADRMNAAFISRLTMFARTLKMPLYEDGAVCTVVHPFVWYDIMQDSDIKNMSTYSYPELLFNGEMGYWMGMRFIVSANAKVFYGAGATATSSLVTTLSTASAIGDTNIKVASVTTVAVGNIVALIDGAESGNTWYDTTEAFVVTAVGTTGAGGTGLTGYALDPGPNAAGGLRYAHASGITVNNNNSVYPNVVLGPNSITKACSGLTGPYGETVVTGPFDKLGRFLTFGWYGIEGWARTLEGWLLRGECGSSQY